MKTVHVHLGQRSYDIQIAAGLLARLPQVLQEAEIGRKLFVVATPRVFELHGSALLERLAQQGFEVSSIQIPDGEKHKNLETVENIYTLLIAQGADRSAVLVALGGGVTGDIAGFAAATYLRGIPYVQVPTTLLAQVDSSVGGKTGVNHRLGKNLIGAFYQPDLVCVDTHTLATLPDRELRSGIYEVLKYGLIYDAAFWDYLERHLPKILTRDPDVLEVVISRCCEIKAEVTSLDERESDLRRILNFGHTFGHALEAATAYQSLTHGEAVAHGMIAAARLSSRMELLDPAQSSRIESVVRQVGQLPSIDTVPADDILEAMRRDKKRRHDHLVFILLKEIGRTQIHENVPEQLVRKVWLELVQQAQVG